MDIGATASMNAQHVEAYLGRCDDGINWAMIRAAQIPSPAYRVVPLQDMFGLGSEARMNVPSLQQRQLALAFCRQTCCAPNWPQSWRTARRSVRPPAPAVRQARKRRLGCLSGVGLA